MKLSLFPALLLILLSSCSLLSGGHGGEDSNRVSQYDFELDNGVAPSGDKHREKVNREEELLSEGMTAFERGVYSIARNSFEKFRKEFPSSYFLPLVEMKIADCLFYLAQYPEAIEAYEEFIRVRQGHEAIAYARYKIGESNLLRYRGPAKDQTPIKLALKEFRNTIKRYPDSQYAVLAKAGIKKGRAKLAEHQREVALFYARQKKKKPALKRLTILLDLYGDTDAAKLSPETLREEFLFDDEDIASLTPKLSERRSKKNLDTIKSDSESLRAIAKGRLAAPSGALEQISAPAKKLPKSASEIPLKLRCDLAEELVSFEIKIPSEFELVEDSLENNSRTLVFVPQTLQLAEVSTVLSSCQNQGLTMQAYLKDGRIRIQVHGDQRIDDLILLEIDKPRRIVLQSS